MAYFSLGLICLILSLAELSLMPYLSIFNAVPFLLLPFIILISLRYKSPYFAILVIIFGLLYDFASNGFFGAFTLVFMGMYWLSRLFFYGEARFRHIQIFIFLLSIGTVCLYASQLPILFQTNFFGWENFLVIATFGTALTLIFGLLEYRLFAAYFEWLNRKYDERNK